MNRSSLSIIQEDSGVYSSPFLNTDELKMNLRRTRNSFRGFGETGSVLYGDN